MRRLAGLAGFALWGLLSGCLPAGGPMKATTDAEPSASSALEDPALPGSDVPGGSGSPGGVSGGWGGAGEEAFSAKGGGTAGNANPIIALSPDVLGPKADDVIVDDPQLVVRLYYGSKFQKELDPNGTPAPMTISAFFPAALKFWIRSGITDPKDPSKIIWPEFSKGATAGAVRAVFVPSGKPPSEIRYCDAKIDVSHLAEGYNVAFPALPLGAGELKIYYYLNLVPAEEGGLTEAEIPHYHPQGFSAFPDGASYEALEKTPYRDLGSFLISVSNWIPPLL